MLITFSVKNWKSFRDDTKLNLVAGTEKQHSERLPEIKKNLRVLPIAAIYGGNASGKSNFLDALAFARNFVVKGVDVEESISLKCFRLEEKTASASVKFTFQMLVHSDTEGELCYEYSFEIDNARVLSEKLTWIKPNSEKLLYKRDQNFSVIKDGAIKEDSMLSSIMDATRENQLYLTNIAGQNTTKFKCKKLLDVYNWFKQVVYITPSAVPALPSLLAMKDSIGNYLRQLDTGIDHLDFRPIDSANLPVPSKILDDIQKNALKKYNKRFFWAFNKNIFIADSISGNVEFKKLISLHKNAKNKTVEFELSDESDGTLRAIDLLPCFVDAARTQSRKVYIIDEADRSLHTLLLRQLLQAYLNSCDPTSRSQIIFSTHDVLQMDQEILRRDEMWFTERKRDGATTLTSLAAFKDVKNDTSIRKDYLNGHFGGIPNIFLPSFLDTEEEGVDESKEAL